MKRISAARAKWILRKYLKSRIFWSRKILLFDGLYELVDELELHLEPIRLGSGDCDERAFVMMGRVLEEHPKYLFGFVEGYDRRNLKHAWCFFMSEAEEVLCVEPSSAEIFTPSIEKVYHFIR